MKNGKMPKLDEELEKTAIASLILTEDRALAPYYKNKNKNQYLFYQKTKISKEFYSFQMQSNVVCSNPMDFVNLKGIEFPLQYPRGRTSLLRKELPLILHFYTQDIKLQVIFVRTK